VAAVWVEPNRAECPPTAPYWPRLRGNDHGTVIISGRGLAGLRHQVGIVLLAQELPHEAGVLIAVPGKDLIELEPV
jgi:hypothetical protein